MSDSLNQSAASALIDQLRPESTVAGPTASIFVFGLIKAGSTLLNRIVQPIAHANGLERYSLHQKLSSLGVAPADCPAEAAGFFQPSGFAYTGFRSFDHSFDIPGFASGRSVLLVRDPRDQLTSLYFSTALSHRPPGDGYSDTIANEFRQRRDHANSVGVDEWVTQEVNYIRRHHQVMIEKLQGIDHKLFRYEDVVFDKAHWIDLLADYLKLEIRPALKQRVLSTVDVVPDQEEPSSHIRRVTPGDHQDKLSPDTIAFLDRELGDILSHYGYSTGQ